MLGLVAVQRPTSWRGFPHCGGEDSRAPKSNPPQRHLLDHLHPRLHPFLIRKSSFQKWRHPPPLLQRPLCPRRDQSTAVMRLLHSPGFLRCGDQWTPLPLWGNRFAGPAASALTDQPGPALPPNASPCSLPRMIWLPFMCRWLPCPPQPLPRIPWPTVGTKAVEAVSPLGVLCPPLSWGSHPHNHDKACPSGK